MALDATGAVGSMIEVRDVAAKKASGRLIPLHPDLRAAPVDWRTITIGNAPVIRSERGGKMTAVSIVNWVAAAYREIGLDRCSPHSARRTFITGAARLVHKTGGSLRHVQLLAAHPSILRTQRYIERGTDAQRKLVSLI
jgi:integrase